MAKTAVELMKGSIDMHLHVGPSIHFIPTLVDCLEAAQQAKNWGMKAIVFKDQFIPTTDRAYLVNKVVEDFEAIGGVNLNLPSGGLNPWAVRACFLSGGKVVWMPAMHAKSWIERVGQQADKFNFPNVEDTLTVIDENGKLKPAVLEILDIIAENNGVMNTGHLSPKECIALVEEGKMRGLKKMVINHPLSKGVGMTLDEQKYVVEKGAFLEHTFGKTLPRMEQLDPKIIANTIKEIGAEHCVMSTDTGFTYYPPPTEAMRMYIEIMRWAGISDSEIEVMIKQNPIYLLDLA